jgi:hypothetical protein
VVLVLLEVTLLLVLVVTAETVLQTPSQELRLPMLVVVVVAQEETLEMVELVALVIPVVLVAHTTATVELVLQTLVAVAVAVDSRSLTRSNLLVVLVDQVLLLW